MRNKYYYMPLLIIFVFFSSSYSQSFSVNHIQEIILPGKNVERPQLSKDGSWLSLETYHERGGFEVYFVRLNNSSVVIPLKKKPNSTRNLSASQVKWSATNNEIFYLIGTDQIGGLHFYKMDLKLFSDNKSYLDDLCEKIFGQHKVKIQTYATNVDFEKDYFLFAQTVNKNETQLSIFTSYLDNLPEPYKGGVSINHFSVNPYNQVAFAKQRKENKQSKIVILADDSDPTTEAIWNRPNSILSEMAPQFSKHNPEKYVAFLAQEKSISKDWYLWLLIDPFTNHAKLTKIDGPILTNDETDALNDLNLAWHPDEDVIFYVKASEAEDGSNPIFYYGMDSKIKKQLITNTTRNMYINIVGSKIVFGAHGKSDNLDRFTRKAYVADLVINK